MMCISNFLSILIKIKINAFTYRKDSQKKLKKSFSFFYWFTHSFRKYKGLFHMTFTFYEKQAIVFIHSHFFYLLLITINYFYQFLFYFFIKLFAHLKLHCRMTWNSVQYSMSNFYLPKNYLIGVFKNFLYWITFFLPMSKRWSSWKIFTEIFTPIVFFF